MSTYTYPIAADEKARIAKLREYKVLNSDVEPAFSRLTNMVKMFFDVPIVAITFMDEETQYLKSPHGLGSVCSTPRSAAICNYTVLSNDVFVVPDLSADKRFIHNILVTEPPHIRFYAGAPIVLKEDNQTFRLGSLCVIDTQPKHDFDKQKQQLLAEFGAMAADALQLHKNQRQAKHDRQMKSELLANMSHEIRTPMNGIMGMVDMLDDTPLTEEQRDYVDNIKTSTDHLLVIINGILDLSKVEAGRMTIDSVPMNLSALCNEVVSLFTAKARKRGLTLDYHYTGALSPYVQGDPVRLKQILANLVNNAIKFTREGGRVNINVTYALYSNWSYCVVQDKDSNDENCSEMICIAVTDTGVGIKPESLEAIFDAYNQADKSTHRLYGGTGLGLSVCKSLVELMGGSIRVKSDVGVGTTFEVILPLPTLDHEQYEVSQYATRVEPEPLTQCTGHVLLVEDDNVNAMIAKKALVSCGHTVTHVMDGQKAVEAFADDPKRYDVILMDHHMPIMDGIHATLKLREMYDEATLPPIIALTANAMDGERERYLQAGMQDYCTKPFKKEQLNAIVQYWLMHKYSMQMD